jgi:hypothetical protein
LRKMDEAEHDQWMLAADLLHHRLLAAQETSWLTDPAEKLHTLTLGAAFTRHTVANVYGRPPELCHYTRVANLEPILQSGCLRGTNAEQCNDTREVVHPRERIDKCLENLIRARFPRSPQRKFFSHIRYLITRVRPDYYVTCFSSRDNGRTEWGEYADRGKGIVIVFDTNELADPIGSIAREVVSLRPIIYEPARQRDQLSEACDLAIRTIALCRGRGWRFSMIDPFIQMVAAMLCSHLTHQATAFKHEFWADEREWRLVMPVYGDTTGNEAIHTTQDGRTYVEFRPSRGPLPITRVVVGPAAPEETVNLIETVLRTYGHAAPVSRSDIPLRSTSDP